MSECNDSLCDLTDRMLRCLLIFLIVFTCILVVVVPMAFIGHTLVESAYDREIKEREREIMELERRVYVEGSR